MIFFSAAVKLPVRKTNEQSFDESIYYFSVNIANKG